MQLHPRKIARRAASVTADEIVTALSQDATAEERQRLTVKFTGSFPGFSADQVKLVVDAHLKEKAMEGIALSKKISTIGASVKESARNLGNVHRQVSNTVDALAKEAGLDSPVPKVLVSGKKSKTSKHAQQPTTAQQQQHVQQGNAKGKGKRQRPPDTQDSTTRKCIALGVQSSASDSGVGSGSSSDSDSDSSSGGMKTPPCHLYQFVSLCVNSMLLHHRFTLAAPASQNYLGLRGSTY